MFGAAARFFYFCSTRLSSQCDLTTGRSTAANRSSVRDAPLVGDDCRLHGRRAASATNAGFCRIAFTGWTASGCLWPRRPRTTPGHFGVDSRAAPAAREPWPPTRCGGFRRPSHVRATPPCRRPAPTGCGCASPRSGGDHLRHAHPPALAGGRLHPVAQRRGASGGTPRSITRRRTARFASASTATCSSTSS